MQHSVIFFIQPIDQPLNSERRWNFGNSGANKGYILYIFIMKSYMKHKK